MKKSLFLLIAILLISACERPYDGEKRIVIEGKLVDQNANPIVNQEVEIYVGEQRKLVFGLGRDLISFSKTNADGRFKLAFPSPRNNEMIEIAIEDSFQNKIYQDLYLLANLDNFKNFRLNVETVTLFRQQDIVGFKIIPNQVTPNAFIAALSITATQSTNGFVDLRKPTSNPGNNLLITDFQVLKNQTFTINYKVVQLGSEVNKAVVVTIGNQFLTYTLNY